MQDDLIASASMVTTVSSYKVWDALVNPVAIKQVMFGTTVVSDWKVGSPIVWMGEWQGKPYQDKGVILQFEPRQTLQYTHYSPFSGLPDQPENYHTEKVFGYPFR